MSAALADVLELVRPLVAATTLGVVSQWFVVQAFVCDSRHRPGLLLKLYTVFYGGILPLGTTIAAASYAGSFGGGPDVIGVVGFSVGVLGGTVMAARELW